MRDFFLLVKAVYSNAFAGTRIKKGKTVVRKRTLWPLFLTSLLMAVVFAGEPIFALFAWQSMGVSKEALLSYLSAHLSAFLCYAFFSCASNNVSLFYAIDDEPFLPLPIKGGRLFLARFTLSLAYAFLYSFLPIVLTMALGGYACLLPTWGIVLSVVMAIFLVVGIDALAFVLVTLVYSLFRIPKNRSATTILSLAFSFLSFLFVLILSFAVIDGENADAISDEIQAVCSRLSFLDWTVFLPRKAMLLEDGLSILSFFSVLALCFLCVVSGVLAGNLFYRRKLVETGKKKKRKEDRNVLSEVEKAFLFSYRHPFLMQVKREFLNFRRHSNVLVSSLIGSVSMIVSMAVVIPVVLSLGEEGIPENIVFLLVFSLVLVSLFHPSGREVDASFEDVPREGKRLSFQQGRLRDVFFLPHRLDHDADLFHPERLWRAGDLLLHSCPFCLLPLRQCRQPSFRHPLCRLFLRQQPRDSSKRLGAEARLSCDVLLPSSLHRHHRFVFRLSSFRSLFGTAGVFPSSFALRLSFLSALQKRV